MAILLNIVKLPFIFWFTCDTLKEYTNLATAGMVKLHFHSNNIMNFINIVIPI